jgi:hypothetical protein
MASTASWRKICRNKRQREKWRHGGVAYQWRSNNGVSAYRLNGAAIEAKSNKRQQ